MAKIYKKKIHVFFVSVFVVMGIVSMTSVAKASPTAEDFSVVPTEVDTTYNPQTIVIAMTASSGDEHDSIDLDRSYCHLESASDSTIIIRGVLEHVGGDNYTCTVTLPVGALHGEWSPYVYLINSQLWASSSEYYVVTTIENTADESMEDISMPELPAFAISPQTINTDTEPQTVSMVFSASDSDYNSSGIDVSRSTCNSHYSGGYQYIESNIIHISEDQYQCDLVFPIGSKSGDWDFNLNLYDNVGNSFYFENSYISHQHPHVEEMITNTATTEDTTGPALTSFSLNRSRIDTRVTEKSVVASFSLEDTAGIDVEEGFYCSVTSEDGSENVYGYLSEIAPDRYTCTVYFPVGSVEGKWYFDFYFSDVLENDSSYYARNAENENDIANAVGGDPDTVGIVTVGVSTDPIADIFDAISAELMLLGIESNIGDVTGSNYTSFSGLYFEKSVDGEKIGRITFDSALDLSDPDTQAFLQNLGDKMNASAEGIIGLDFRGTSDSVTLKGVHATLKFYGLDELGFTADSTSDDVTAKLKAFDDDGNPIDIAALVSGMGTYLGACEVGGGCYTFTVGVNHFTEYRIDDDTEDEVDDTNDKTTSDEKNSIVVKSDNDDYSCGKNCRLYKKYRKEFRTELHKSRYKEMKSLKKTNEASFNEMKAIYDRYSLAGETVRKTLDVKTMEMYKKYRSYSGYKKYLRYKNLSGK